MKPMTSQPKNIPKNILIVGGGTSGWMVAATLARQWKDKDISLKLIESESIGTIGVGEGSTPKMRRFFDSLNIDEREWMPKCNATYKCGIRFPSWATREGFKSYYHPFFSQKDDTSIRAFHQNATLRSKNFNVYAHPDSFFVSNFLASEKLAPTPDKKTDYHTDYAYHFDASLLGEFLRNFSVQNGVTHVSDTVSEVLRSENGDISGVKTDQHGTIDADFFIDCTGFSGLIINKTLGVEFLPYKKFLFNDSAVALPSNINLDKGLPAQTVSKALKNGWMWNIPLTNRFGNGYVYSSDFTDQNSAEEELRKQLGLMDGAVEARHLKMRVGRSAVCWERNCIAIGLSQGFIEPLEATALMIVQDTAETFANKLESSGNTDKSRAEVNTKVNSIFDGVRNYVQMHYKLNTRSDTEYWLENRKNVHISDDMEKILRVWDKGGDLLSELRNQASRLVYSPTSWYCILAGMGRFRNKPKRPKANVQYYSKKQAEEHSRSFIQQFPSHLVAIQEHSKTP